MSWSSRSGTQIRRRKVDLRRRSGRRSSSTTARTACGRPETAGSPDCLPQTSRSDLILNVSKVASISPTWAPATGERLSAAEPALTDRAEVDAADKRRWTEPPLVRWRAGILGNVSFRRRWRVRCEGSAQRCVSLHEGWPARGRARWAIDVLRSARRQRARRAGRDQLHRWACDNGQGDGR